MHNMIYRLYEEYKNKKIDSCELMDKLDFTEGREFLLEMSMVKRIVSYTDSFASVYDAHNSPAFEHEFKNYFTIYLQYVSIEGRDIEDFSFKDFIKHLMDKNIEAIKDFEKCKNKTLFWDFVEEIQQYINKGK